MVTYLFAVQSLQIRAGTSCVVSCPYMILSEPQHAQVRPIEPYSSSVKKDSTRLQLCQIESTPLYLLRDKPTVWPVEPATSIQRIELWLLRDFPAFAAGAATCIAWLDRSGYTV